MTAQRNASRAVPLLALVAHVPEAWPSLAISAPFTVVIPPWPGLLCHFSRPSQEEWGAGESVIPFHGSLHVLVLLQATQPLHLIFRQGGRSRWRPRDEGPPSHRRGPTITIDPSVAWSRRAFLISISHRSTFLLSSSMSSGSGTVT